MRTLALALRLLLPLSPGLAACEPNGLSITETPPEAFALTGCGAKTSKPWVIDGHSNYTLEALTIGPNCAKAAVTLVVRAPEGTPALVWAAATQDIFGLYDAPDAKTMERALTDWIDQNHLMWKTANALPAWADGKPGPGAENEEFPFHAENWFDRPSWEQMRTENAPVFAFPQGRESLAVFVLRDGRLEQVGLQQFPG